MFNRQEEYTTLSKQLLDFSTFCAHAAHPEAMVRKKLYQLIVLSQDPSPHIEVEKEPKLLSTYDLFDRR